MITDTGVSRADTLGLGDTTLKDSQLRQHFRLLNTLVDEVSSASTLPVLLYRAIDAACQLTGTRYGAILLFGPAGGVDQLATHGLSPSQRDSVLENLRVTAHSEMPPNILKVLNTIHFNRKAVFSFLPSLDFFISVPISLQGQVLGAICVAERQADAEEIASELQRIVLHMFATRIAISMHYLAMERQTKEKVQRAAKVTQDTETLYEITKLAVSSLELKDVLANSLPLILKDVGVDAAEIWLLNPALNVLELKGQGGLNNGTIFGPKPLKLSEGIPGLAAQSLHPVVINDRQIMTSQIDSEAMAQGLNVVGAFPLVAREAALGVLCVAKQSPDGLEDGWDEMLERIAAGLAIAIKNAQLFEDLRHSEERYRILAEHVPAAIFRYRLRPTRCCEYMSPNVVALTGYTPEEFYSDPELLANVAHVDDRAVIHAMRLAPETFREPVTIRAVRKNGSETWLDVHVEPIYDLSSKIIAVQGIVRSANKLPEEQEADLLKSEFIGLISHELKAPLAAIKGIASMALDSRGHSSLNVSDMKEFFEIIARQTDRLVELANNLTDMSRIEGGSLTIYPEPTMLASLLKDVNEVFVRVHNSHQLEINVPDDLPNVNADPRRTIQVLTNLLDNASKYSPPDTTITIAAECDAREVTVHVTDQGRGIAPEKLPAIFNKFSKVHDDDIHRLSGTGLGLSICKGIVEAHGGRIWASSAPTGKGSTFSFTLPVVIEASLQVVRDASLQLAVPDEPESPDVANRQQVKISKRASHLGSVSRGRERTRVLVVDDDPQALRHLQRLLTDSGYHPLLSSDPTAVAETIVEEEPDLIILDLVFPKDNGLDLLRSIREFSGVPIIFITASNEETSKLTALRMGADDYIIKPFSPTEVIARMEAVLRRRTMPDTVEVRPPLAVGDLQIDFARRRVTLRGKAVSLTATEYKLLYELANSAGRVMTYDQITHRVWGEEYKGARELLRSFVSNLRRKLEDDSRHPRYIITEPQVGYYMRSGGGSAPTPPTD